MHLVEDCGEEQLSLFFIVTDYFYQLAHEVCVLVDSFLLKNLPEVVLHLGKVELHVTRQRLWST